MGRGGGLVGGWYSRLTAANLWKKNENKKGYVLTNKQFKITPRGQGFLSLKTKKKRSFLRKADKFSLDCLPGTK